jgi:hypothetical protein
MESELLELTMKVPPLVDLTIYSEELDCVSGIPGPIHDTCNPGMI